MVELKTGLVEWSYLEVEVRLPRRFGVPLVELSSTPLVGVSFPEELEGRGVRPDF